MQALLDYLTLKELENGHFSAPSKPNAWPRVFGGLLLAQAVMAGHNWLEQQGEGDKFIHSLHGYFIRPGRVDCPFTYKVSVLRQGKSFSVCEIRAYQLENPQSSNSWEIFIAHLSFQRKEISPSYQAILKQDAFSSPTDGAHSDIGPYDEQYKAPFELASYYWQLQKPFIFCAGDKANYIPRKQPVSESQNWFAIKDIAKFKDRLSPKYYSAILAYLSDMTILDNALIAHKESIFTRHMQTGSLDHAIWFHQNFDQQTIAQACEGWLLYRINSPISGSGRCFSRGEIYDEKGVLLLSTAQEGLMREKWYKKA